MVDFDGINEENEIDLAEFENVINHINKKMEGIQLPESLNSKNLMHLIENAGTPKLEKAKQNKTIYIKFLSAAACAAVVFIGYRMSDSSWVDQSTTQAAPKAALYAASVDGSADNANSGAAMLAASPTVELGEDTKTISPRMSNDVMTYEEESVSGIQLADPEYTKIIEKAETIREEILIDLSSQQHGGVTVIYGENPGINIWAVDETAVTRVVDKYNSEELPISVAATDCSLADLEDFAKIFTDYKLENGDYIFCYVDQELNNVSFYATSKNIDEVQRIIAEEIKKSAMPQIKFTTLLTD